MIRTVAVMGTLVTIHVAGGGTDEAASSEAAAAVGRGFDWFRYIEACCSRFDPDSELVRLCAHVGTPVSASATLFEAVRFALAVAEQSDGAFDPTVGLAMEALGFDRDHRTGQSLRMDVGPVDRVSYRDVRLDEDRKTVTLLRPLRLDLGAVAKGMAIDMAARELRPFTNFAIGAGGDLYLGGCGPGGKPWSIGIRHPREDDRFIDVVRVTDKAVCTSGDYERASPKNAEEHHILDPATGRSARGAASVTVIAPAAMVADALATAAFVLGPADGLRLLERQGVAGLIVSSTLERHATDDFPAITPQVLSHAKGDPHPSAGGAHPARGGGRRRQTAVGRLR